MAASLLPITILIIHIGSFLISLCSAQAPCSTLFTFNGSILNFTKCAALPTQGAILSWTFYEGNSTLDVAFSGTAPSSSGWVGWGINPSVEGQMSGTSALIAFNSAKNGSNLLPYKLTDAVKLDGDPLVCSPIDLTILSTAVEIQGASMSFMATLKLPPNKTTLNHVWNRGPGMHGFQPLQHSVASVDLLGTQTIDMYTAQAFVSPGPPYLTLKRAHGIINTFSWGILFPLGIIFARYLRLVSDSLWFYIHVACQVIAYIMGMMGWALGMRLRTVTLVIHASHQNIGITLFVLASVQICALILRPNKNHKLRRYWNYYHYTLGYTIVLLGVINIFQGLNILAPGGNWRAGYVGSLILMVVVAAVLEAVTWIRYFCQKDGR